MRNYAAGRPRTAYRSRKRRCTGTSIERGRLAKLSSSLESTDTLLKPVP